jgi:hypothetical protein
LKERRQSHIEYSKNLLKSINIIIPLHNLINRTSGEAFQQKNEKRKNTELQQQTD